jgi:hypothetical protein
MRKLTVTLAIGIAMLVAVPAASAATTTYPVLTESTMYCDGIDDPLTCIEGPDPSDLPSPIEEPDLEDPFSPSEPNVTEAQCSARVIRDYATSLIHLQNFCPVKTAFNDALLAVMRGPGLPAPRCDRLNDRLVLHYLMGSGGTSLRPFSGDCKRGTLTLDF